MHKTNDRGLDTVSTDPPVDDILQLACRAPSVHNTQPWKWRVSGSHVDLFADFTRQLVYADPSRRDLMISCGAALHHLQSAAAVLGWTSRVRRLPDPSDERHVASVELRRSRVTTDAGALLRAIQSRRTDRRRPTSNPVPIDRLHGLSAVGAVWGAQVVPVLGESARQRLHDLTHRADVIQKRNHRYIDELASWSGTSGPDGIPREHIPARVEFGSTTPEDAATRRFPGGTLTDHEPDPEPSQGGMLLVCTSADDAISWVRAGEALSAIWLHATSENLSVLPLSQAVEVDQTRHELQEDVLGGLVFPQILLRVGWLSTAHGDLAATPRRSLVEVRVPR